MHLFTSLTPFTSDHCTVSASINLPIPCHAIRKTKWCLDEADYVGLGDSIRDYDWTFLDNDNQTFDTRSNRFIDTLTELFHRHISKMTTIYDLTTNHG